MDFAKYFLESVPSENEMLEPVKTNIKNSRKINRNETRAKSEKVIWSYQ